jgi:hypothetical protein
MQGVSAEDGVRAAGMAGNTMFGRAIYAIT